MEVGADDLCKVGRNPMKSTILFVFAIVAANAQPTWTDVLNVAGSVPTQANGTAWKIGTVAQPAQVQNTSLAAIGGALSFPVSMLTGAGNQGGSVNCGGAVAPMAFIESNGVSGVKGVGFLGSFNAPAAGVPLTYQPNQNVYEAVFFHEDYCYGSTAGSTSREYGFFLAASNSSVWVYWGTKENQAGQVQAQMQIPGVHPNTQYYFSMYPSGNATSCGFNVYVLDAGFNTVYPLTYIPVGAYNYGGTITAADPGFCAAVTAPMSGFVSANIVAGVGVSGTLPAPSVLNLGLQRVYVGT